MEKFNKDTLRLRSVEEGVLFFEFLGSLRGEFCFDTEFSLFLVVLFEVEFDVNHASEVGGDVVFKTFNF